MILLASDMIDCIFPSASTVRSEERRVGKVIGTKGETLIKIVLSEDGGMLSAFPVK